MSLVLRLERDIVGSPIAPAPDVDVNVCMAPGVVPMSERESGDRWTGRETELIRIVPDWTGKAAPR